MSIFATTKAATGSIRLRQATIATGAAQTHGFEDMAAMRGYGGIISGVHCELPEVVQSAGGSANLFPLLGVSPVLAAPSPRPKISR